MSTSKTKNMILISLFAALTAVFSQISIPLPFSPVPINLALLSVFIVGGLLNAKHSLISQLIFMGLGLIGLPVFANFGAGIGTLLGPTGGYIIGYALAAFTIGLLNQNKDNNFIKLIISMVIGLAVCYTFGTLWFVLSTKNTWLASLSMCVFPFLLGDALKITAATLLIKRLKKIIK